jgi:hypothetical protein
MTLWFDKHGLPSFKPYMYEDLNVADHGRQPSLPSHQVAPQSVAEKLRHLHVSENLGLMLCIGAQRQRRLLISLGASPEPRAVLN